MKRILRGSALAGYMVVAVWLAFLATGAQQGAYAQQILMPGQTVVYYNGYGQGYYGGYVPRYGATYGLAPSYGYSGYGYGYRPYGYNGDYPGYSSGPFGPRTFGSPTYYIGY